MGPFIFLLYAFIFLQQGETSKHVEIYKALEAALTTETNQYTLQRIFYPYELVSDDDQVDIVICQEDFTVKNISGASFSNIFDFNPDVNKWIISGGYLCYEYDYDYERGGPCSGPYYAKFSLYSTKTTKFLGNYIEQLGDYIPMLEFTFYSILDSLSQINFRAYDNTYIERKYLNKSITLSIDHLPGDIFSYELFDVLSSLLSWAKHYARTNTSEYSTRLDSDRWFVNYECGYEPKKHSYTLSSIDYHGVVLLCSAYSLNTFIMLSGFYIIYIFIGTDTIFNILSTTLLSQLGLHKTLKIWFASSASVMFFVNLVCFILDLLYISGDYHFISFVAVFLIMLLFIFIEVCVIHYITKKHSNITNVWVRALYSYACCNILWFAHRVGKCFIVSVYFIAVAPAQTLAAITLCLSSILMIIIFMGLVIQAFVALKSEGKKCKSVCKSLYVFLTLISIVSYLILFTLIFVDLTQHGLSASTVGSVILTFAIPFIVLIIGMVVKDHLKKNSSNNEDEKNPLIIQEVQS